VHDSCLREFGSDVWVALRARSRSTAQQASAPIRIAVVDWLTGLGLLKHRDDPEGAN
jgi:hypothetical protein